MLMYERSFHLEKRLTEKILDNLKKFFQNSPVLFCQTFKETKK
jgi:hypothetical protein